MPALFCVWVVAEGYSFFPSEQAYSSWIWDAHLDCYGGQRRILLGLLCGVCVCVLHRLLLDLRVGMPAQFWLCVWVVAGFMDMACPPQLLRCNGVYSWGCYGVCVCVRRFRLLKGATPSPTTVEGARSSTDFYLI